MYLRTHTWIAVVVAAVVVAVAVLTSASVTLANPADDLYDYYQFRFHSGLPGNKWTVSPEGKAGGVGPAQMAIPVAYTPCAGNAILSANVGMADSGLRLGWHGDKINGTLSPAFGLGKSGHGVYLTYTLTGDKGEPSYNWQWQILAEKGSRPAVAIGGIDMVNQRAATQHRPLSGEARSFYAVATKQVGGESQHLTYATVGIGTGRFKGPFGGVCTRFHERATVAAEYDTLGVNANATYAFRDPQESHNFTLIVGIADLGYWTYGLTYTNNW